MPNDSEPDSEKQKRVYLDLKRRAAAELECLFLWQEASKKSGWILGQPVGYINPNLPPQEQLRELSRRRQVEMEYFKKTTEIMAPYHVFD